ncbi:MAG: WYL domain-containing protein [Archangium sp.]|nr:WYL domain-containing protein [Archangium sp.]
MSSPAERGRSQAYERLRRLLFLVPFVSKHPGLKVEEVAKAVGVSKDELLEELDLLTMVGRPPFQPDDFIDVYVEDDRVYVDLNQRLSAPPRLTAAEGVALAAAAALLKPAAGGALSSALQRIEKVLPPQSVQRYREMSRQLDVATEAPDSIAVLTQAIVEHREISLGYVSVNRGEAEQRRVRPNELFSHRGQWYLSGYCLTRQGERLFRVDRITQLSLLAERFAPGADAAPHLPGTGEVEKPVRVRFSAELAPYQQERFGDAAVTQTDGSVVVTVPGDSERWLTRWVLSFGGNATVLEPDWAIRAVAEAAAASLQSG